MVYTKADHSEDVQADLKQVVLKWKKNFEISRWQWQVRMDQMMRQQMAAAATPSAGLLSARLPLPAAGTLHVMESITTAADNNPQSIAVQNMAVPGRRTQVMSANLEPLGQRQPVGSQFALTTEGPVVHRSIQCSGSECVVVSPAKKPRIETTAQPKEDDIDRIVEELVASRKASIKTVSVGVQVKTQTILSLQRKNVSLSASTQTPNIDTEDSYEAMLLRGGPKPPPPPPAVVITTHKIVCSKCDGHLNAGQKSASDISQKTTVKLNFMNRNERKREHSTLSERFTKAQEDFDKLFEGEFELHSWCLPVTIYFILRYATKNNKNQNGVPFEISESAAHYQNACN